MAFVSSHANPFFGLRDLRALCGKSSWLFFFSGLLLLAWGTTAYGTEPFSVHVVKPITNRMILPKGGPPTGPETRELKVTACRGEFEPASFTVTARESVKRLKVEATGLQGAQARIPSSAVDIRVVKCWLQAGVQVYHTDKRLLVPELLLKDDGLVRVDLDKKENYLRDSDASGADTYVLISGPTSHTMKFLKPRDADTLQPVDIDAGTTRQFWITVHVPEHTQPGEYKGRIRLTAESSPPVELTLQVRVLPFALAKPRLRYSIYYRGRLTRTGQGSIGSEHKSLEQYEAEMRNLKDHGVEYPTVYQSYDRVLLEGVFRIRDKVGLPKGPLYTLGMVTGNATATVELDRLRRSVRKWIEIAKQHGYDQVYIYATDEAKADRLKSQRAAWQAVHEAGGKVFVACYKDAFNLVGDLLDLAVLGPPLQPNQAKQYHAVGNQVLSYGNPQVGVEQPETYRRNFGLLLWKAGYDGAMDYAYQHAYGHAWNDFDHKRYRDHMFAYPTVDGVIDTIEWEGFREGVDDVRYLSTLLDEIDKARDRNAEMAAAAEKWVGEIDPGSDPDTVRTKIIEWIMALRAVPVSDNRVH